MPKPKHPKLAHSGEPKTQAPAEEIRMFELTEGVDAGRGAGIGSSVISKSAPADDPMILEARRYEKREISRGWDRG